MRMESTTAKQLLLEACNHIVISMRERCKVSNWPQDNQDEEGVKQPAVDQRVTPLLESVDPN